MNRPSAKPKSGRKPGCLPAKAPAPRKELGSEFFDFLSGFEGYSGNDVARMNRRYEYLVDPFRDDIRNARVLDLAAHDGRWSYAMAFAGAETVLAVEARPELAAKFAMFPDPALRNRVRFRTNDIFDELRNLDTAGERFDVVALFGILYHVMDHFLLLRNVVRLHPSLILIDSEFISTGNSMIQLVRERTDNALNAIPQHEDSAIAIVGIPSMGAMERMAEVLGYGCQWLDWDALPPERRRGVPDYFRDKPKRRRSCALRPLR